MNNLYYKGIEFNETKDKFTGLALKKNILDACLMAANKYYLTSPWFTNDEIVLVYSYKPCKLKNNHFS